MTILVLIFILLILATVSFELVNIYDFRLFAILIVSTGILVLLGTKDLRDYQDLLNKMRFNLFLTAMLMSMFMTLNQLSNHLMTMSTFVVSFKPLIIAALVYLPAYNILSRLIDLKQSFKQADLSVLSRREKEVYDEIMKKKSNKEISESLYIAEATVKKHVQHILKKLECKDRYELIDKNINND